MNVGAQLREARVARGLSIAGLAATTRIQPRVLDAIERNDLSAMPARIYARGFVRAYAREVGLDADEVTRQFFSQFEEPEPEPPPPAPPDTPREEMLRSWGPALAAIALIIAFVTWVVPRFGGTGEPEPNAVGTSGNARTSGDPTLGAAAQATRGAVSPAAGTSPQTAGIVVILEAQGPSWVAATVDGTRQLYRLVEPGSRHTLRGSREVVIRVGDAGAVKWSVNGRTATAMGAAGEVRTVRVTRENAAAVR